MGKAVRNASLRKGTLMNLMSPISRIRQRAAAHTMGPRQQGVPAIVIVDDKRIRTTLSAKPPVGARLDVGMPVEVVQAKDVAGGGIIVAAARTDDSPVE
jgi:hypothetical protein